MNIDDIIKTINDSKYDDSKVTHDVDAVTPEQKAANDKNWHERCDVSPDVIKGLAVHMASLAPEELMKVIIRLTTDVEKNRLMFVNQELRKHDEFNTAMAGLHEWRAKNAPKAE